MKADLTTPAYAWLDGEVVKWADCVLHARSQGAFWGANVFEGVRGYWSAERQGVSLFRMEAHLERLWQSMKSLHMTIDYSPDDLAAACSALILANECREDVHLCIVAYFGMGPDFDPLAHTEETGVHITAVPAPRSAFGEGLAAKISTWRRISDESMPPRIKCGANYHNSRLAQHEAVRDGYQTALLLNSRGTVSEAPGSCLVMVRGGQLVTPPGTSSVLEGITVNVIAELAETTLRSTLVRREIDRTELYVADELFLCGTRAEIMPVTSVDRIVIGDGRPGHVTSLLQAAYNDLVRGWTGADHGSHGRVGQAAVRPRGLAHA